MAAVENSAADAAATRVFESFMIPPFEAVVDDLRSGCRVADVQDFLKPWKEV